VVFSTVWAVQSRLASIALFGLIAFSSVWLTLGLMFAWSIAATFVYFVARSYGAPDLLEIHMPSFNQTRVQTSLMGTFSSVFRICIVRLPAFVFTRLVRLKAPGHCHRRRFCHGIVLAAGVTLFGVTTTHYLLRKGGFSGSSLLQLSCVGSVLNVSYRTMLNALFIAAFTHFVDFSALLRLTDIR